MTNQQIEIKEQEIHERAKDTLKKSEKRNRSLYTKMPAMLHSIDTSGSIIDVSDLWLDSFGYERNKVVGCKSVEFLTGKSKRYVESFAMPEFMKTGCARDIPLKFIKKDGGIMDILLSAIAERDEGGNYIRSLAILTDNTERKNAEDALKKAQAEVEELKNRLHAENIYWRDEIKVKPNFEEIISGSEALKQVLRRVKQVSPTDTTVLIIGETGTGKELLAHAVHNNSTRQDRTLVKVNSAALPENLIESELFGHERGAFTGAFKQKIGRFELADGGTIFLDEIGEIPTSMQAKLLRVLQEGEIERLGSSETIKVNVRVIAATSRNLEKAMARGDFLESLYYRLNVFPIKVPPLRERKEDIPLLVEHFVMKYSAKMGKKIETITEKLLDTLKAFDWPGNVRELENIIERLMVISNNNLLEIDEWQMDNVTSHNTSRVSTIKEIEIEHITRILELTAWRVRGSNGAAKILDIKPTTLESKMKKLGILRNR